jgi:Zn-dependent peptidase ImmA (M78 family)
MAVTAEQLAHRILEAIRASGTSQRALAGTIGMDPSALSKALAGHRNFKPFEVALISEALRVSIHDLLMDPDDPASQRTSVAARADPDASSVVRNALSRVDQILELNDLLTSVGVAPRRRGPKLKIHEQLEPREQGEILGTELRELLHLGETDLPPEVPHLATDIEDKLGIDVAIEPVERGLDGLAVTRGDYRLILVSSSIPAPRQRYTIGHELGHIVAEDGQQIVDENIDLSKTPAETRANSFAAAYLMPARAIRRAFAGNTPVTEAVVADLLARYRVSLDALAFRLHNTHIVNAAGRDAVRGMSSAKIALRQGRTADLQARGYRRLPGGLLDRAIEAYSKGLISIRPIASLMGVHPDELLVELAPSRLASEGPGSADAGRSDEPVPNF